MITNVLAALMATALLATPLPVDLGATSASDLGARRHRPELGERRRPRGAARHRPAHRRAHRRTPPEERRVQEDRGADEREGHRREELPPPQAAHHGGATEDGEGRWRLASARGAALIDLLPALALAPWYRRPPFRWSPARSSTSAPAVGAQYVAARIAHAQLEALRRGAFVALRVNLGDADASMQLFVDGNGNGVRTRDIDQGVDPADRPARFDRRARRRRELRLNQRVLDAGGVGMARGRHGSAPDRIDDAHLVLAQRQPHQRHLVCRARAAARNWPFESRAAPGASGSSLRPRLGPVVAMTARLRASPRRPRGPGCRRLVGGGRAPAGPPRPHCQHRSLRRAGRVARHGFGQGDGRSCNW